LVDSKIFASGTRDQGFPRERYAPWRRSSREILGENRGKSRANRIFRRTLVLQQQGKACFAGGAE
jgi:hypothetical protein